MVCPKKSPNPRHQQKSTRKCARSANISKQSVLKFEPHPDWNLGHSFSGLGIDILRHPRCPRRWLATLSPSFPPTILQYSHFQNPPLSAVNPLTHTTSHIHIHQQSQYADDPHTFHSDAALNSFATRRTCALTRGTLLHRCFDFDDRACDSAAFGHGRMPISNKVSA